MCATCNYDTWVNTISDILDVGVSESDDNFLTDVSRWIEDHEHVTPVQVAKIKEKADAVGVDYED